MRRLLNKPVLEQQSMLPDIMSRARKNSYHVLFIMIHFGPNCLLSVWDEVPYLWPVLIPEIGKVLVRVK